MHIIGWVLRMSLKRVLVVTGELAKPMVEEYVKKSRIETKILALPIQVAAFITPKFAAKKIMETVSPKEFDLVLLPGLVSGDVSEVSKIVGIPVFKGPKHAADLPVVLDNLEKIALSTKKPACELIQDLLKKKAFEELNEIRKKAEFLEKKGVGLVIGSEDRKVWTYHGFTPLIVAEIVDAPTLSEEEIQNLAKYYVDSGADIVDVGMMAGGGNPKDAEKVVKTILKTIQKPVSIDTNDVEEMEAAVKAGVNLILSINGQNMEEAAKNPLIIQTPVVVTPADSEGKIPKDWLKRVAQLEKNLLNAKKLGFRKIIADPILEIQSFLESLLGYVEFRKRNPEIPVLFGVGNITELVDVDTVGINFLLALLAWEINANLLFTTEASSKTKGTVKELATALKMVALAKKRGTPPKDLGINLLVLKEKRRKHIDFSEAEKSITIFNALERKGYTHDPLGYFKIKVNHKTGEIYVFHYCPGEEKPDFAVRGLNPKEIYMKIVEENLVSRLDHAAYLGCELQKAKVAIQIGRSYVQDEEVFG